MRPGAWGGLGFRGFNVQTFLGILVGSSPLLGSRQETDVMRPLPGAAPGTLEAMDGLQRGGCSPAWGLWILEGLGTDNPQGPSVVQACGPGCSQGAHGQGRSPSPTPGWQSPEHGHLLLPGHREGLWELGRC